MLEFLFHKSTGFFLLVLLLIGAGVFVLFRLPVMMYPQTRRPQVSVNISHPGISAVDFQEQYAERIESSLMSLADLDLMESTYSTDSSRFNLTFNWDIESEVAHQAVESQMVTINATLPDVIRDSYSVRFFEGENAGYLVMGLTSASTPSDELYNILKNNIEPRLLKLGDLEEIGFYNTKRLVVEMTLQQEKMLSYGLTITDVNAALQTGFLPQPLGSLRTPEGRYSLRLERTERSLENLARLEIKEVGDSIISLDDIAELDIRYTLPSRVFIVKGVPAVQLTATPVEGGNVNALTSDIEEIIEEGRLEGLIPSDTETALYLDPAKYIRKSIENVIQAAIIGGLLAVLVVFLVLGEWKNTVLIATSLPVTIIFSFLFMWAFGGTINLISLGGLALAVGMIVDSTIVVMENIHRHRLEAGEGEGRILQWKKIVLGAVAQVRSPVIASTLTSVLVFLPISFTAPLTNAILGDQARSVVFALLGSLLVSLTVVPVMAFYVFMGHQKQPRILAPLQKGDKKFFQGLISLYGRSLDWLLARKIRAAAFLLAAFGILVTAVLTVFPLIPKEIISTPTSDRVVLFFRNSQISDPEVYMEEILPEMNEKIDEVLGDRLLERFTNLSGRFNQTFLDLRSSDDTEEAMVLLQKAFVSEGDWYYSVMPWDPAALPLPRSFDFQLSLYGPDAAVKVDLLSSIQTLLNEEQIFQRTFSEPSS
ncbi:MAG: efflux RND transporter permease subunit, partial [Spirochaetales bacterium]|nr:efflux RND transporter permease subunit [Spirochaetales bacterium]